MSLLHYKTEDIYLSAYLIAANICRLDKIEDTQGRRKVFILTPEPSENDISSFYNASGTVSALSLCNQMRALKAALLTRNGKGA